MLLANILNDALKVNFYVGLLSVLHTPSPTDASLFFFSYYVRIQKLFCSPTSIYSINVIQETCSDALAVCKSLCCSFTESARTVE